MKEEEKSPKKRLSEQVDMFISQYDDVVNHVQGIITDMAWNEEGHKVFKIGIISETLTQERLDKLVNSGLPVEFEDMSVIYELQGENNFESE